MYHHASPKLRYDTVIAHTDDTVFTSSLVCLHLFVEGQ
jgi:hypothetical protein